MPLWKLLIEKKMTKEEYRLAIGISSATLAKMGKGEKVSMEVIDKTCTFFNCKIEDVVEHIKQRDDT
ncbi:helix-turn-helix transcriptional regulator [Paenibacillus sp. TRM 82003]|nr:helix-turn-helix transcriptional regulator [Paenibacillus sp. TRM 82003]